MKKPRIEIYFVMLFILAAAAISSPYQEPASKAALEASDVFAQRCLSCHRGQYPAQGLNLETDRFQDNLVNVPSGQVPSLKLVDTRDPEQSYLLMKIKGSRDIVGMQMPAYSSPLEPEEILAIENWVRSLEGLDIESRADPIRDKARKPAFWGTTLVNLPTPRSIGKGDVLFRVSHRFFPAAKAGYDAFYGLDGPASILLGIGYGFSDSLSLMLMRANVSKEFELGLQWTRMNPLDTNTPFTMALRGSFSLITLPLPDKETFRSENLRFNLQASFAYRIHPQVSLLLVPGYSTNTNPVEESFQGTFFLGAGGQAMILDEFSILLEWIPVLSGYSLHSGWALGVEKKIGGHVFQVFVLNSVGITTPQFVPGGDLRIGDGEFRIGFNILRWF